MNTEELSNAFDTLVSSYRRFKDFDKKEELDSIEFDEYEKSLWLTAAQNDIVVGLYSGKNSYGESFETTEEMRRYLEALVKQVNYVNSDRVTITGGGVSESSVFYSLPDDIAYIIFEKIVLSGSDASCAAGISANVYPATHDEYNRIARNPFRGPTMYRALRLDCGNGNVEIVSQYDFNSYIIRYLSRPEPIVLEDMPESVSIEGVTTKNECKLNPMLHNLIVNRAVQMALASKGIKANS